MGCDVDWEAGREAWWKYYKARMAKERTDRPSRLKRLRAYRALMEILNKEDDKKKNSYTDNPR